MPKVIGYNGYGKPVRMPEAGTGYVWAVFNGDSGTVRAHGTGETVKARSRAAVVGVSMASVGWTVACRSAMSRPHGHACYLQGPHTEVASIRL